MRAHHRTDARILSRALPISAPAGAGYGAAQGLNPYNSTEDACTAAAVAAWRASCDREPILLREQAEPTRVFALVRRAA